MKGPPRRASTKGIAKFEGEKLVNEVTHLASGVGTTSTSSSSSATASSSSTGNARSSDVDAAKTSLSRNAQTNKVLETRDEGSSSGLEDKKAETRLQSELLEADKVSDVELEKTKKQIELDRSLLNTKQESEKQRQQDNDMKSAVSAEAADAERLELRIAEEKRRRLLLREEEERKISAENEIQRLAQEQEQQQVKQTKSAKAALLSLSAKEKEELKEKRRVVEEKQKKRDAFLNETDLFSSDFATKSEIGNQKQQQTGIDIFGESLAKTSNLFKPLPKQDMINSSDKDKDSLKANVLNDNQQKESLFSTTVSSCTDSKINDVFAPLEFDDSISISLGTGGTNNFSPTADTLFNGTIASEDSGKVDSTNELYNTSPLRAPTRIGKGPSIGKLNNINAGKAAPLISTSNLAIAPSIPVARIGAARKAASEVPSLDKYNSHTITSNDNEPARFGGAERKRSDLTKSNYFSGEEEYTETEGVGGTNSISNFLTRGERDNLTDEDKVNWKAKQNDLGARRKDFHGAVTYAFDGIFSWQMYGSAEAVDEAGNAYTEYLMRCQWGTNWNNLQPWISARRYREFDAIDAELRRVFPNHERNMPHLPAKDFFRFLEADVIDKRRETLENYMSRVVLHLPSILRSKLVSDFLGIKERIKVIKKQLLNVESFSSNPATLNAQTVYGQDPGPPSNKSYTGSLNNERTIITKLSFSGLNGGASDDIAILADPHLILDINKAERICKETISTPFTENQLSHFESALKHLMQCLSNHNTRDKIHVSSSGYRVLVKTTQQWPQLKASCMVDELSNNTDINLIPRALQAEEDLIRFLDDFKNLMASMTMMR